MGFTVVGPDRFLGSGHPDGREQLPPFLGLIESRDAGRTWEPVSLLGERDFHVLEAAGRRIYGFGSVTALAAQGMTNRGIAQELFVVPRTVEMHLSNAFTKLGISSRTQLTGALSSPRTIERGAELP